MTTPNLFLTYVRDAGAASAFYGELFDMEPVFTSPRYGLRGRTRRALLGLER